MEFYPRNEAHARRELEAQLNLFDPPPVAEGEQHGEQREQHGQEAFRNVTEETPAK